MFLQAIGRLRAGVSRSQAASELDGIVSRLQAQRPDSNPGVQVAALTPLRDHILGSGRVVAALSFAGAAVLLAGRGFAETDGLYVARAEPDPAAPSAMESATEHQPPAAVESAVERQPLVAIVGESVAREMYGSPLDAVGQRFVGGRNAPRSYRIVGVVADGRYRRVQEVSGDVFLPYTQTAIPLRYLVIRTSASPAAARGMVRRALAEVDPEQPMSADLTTTELVERASSCATTSSGRWPTTSGPGCPHGKRAGARASSSADSIRSRRYAATSAVRGGIEETWQDLRFAIRLLGRERGFAAAAILALGLGIGLTSSAFTVYNAVLVRGLPVDDPDRIMTLAMRDADGREQGISYLDFQDWRAAATSFEDIAAYSEPAMNVGHPDMAIEVFFGARVTANAFRLLGIEPLIGRDFQPDDDRPGAPAVVMLGHGIWRNRYGADPDVLGRAIRVNDVSATVIGVMPAGFEFPMWAELWQPLWTTPGLADQARDQRTFRAVGSLAGSATIEQAQANLEAVAASLAADHPETNTGFRPWVDPFNEHHNGTFRPVLTALLAAAGIVLLIACANGANLLLARAARRSREVGMRVSLGATRARILRQLLVECLLLGGLAGVLGLGLAALCARLLSMAFEPLMTPFWIDFGIDGRVVAFLALTCLSTTLFFGLASALHTSKANVRDLVGAAGRVGTAGRPERRWTGCLVTAELALTLALCWPAPV